MNLFKQKMAWAAPIAVIFIIFLFSLNLFAQGNPIPKNLPIALVVNDEGHDSTIDKISEAATTTIDGSEPTIKFTKEKEKNIEQLFDDKKYYAALVIPEGFFDDLQGALKNNKQATVKIYINQGYNVIGSTTAKTILNGLVDTLNKRYSETFVKQIGDNKISVDQVTVISAPIKVEEKVYHEITAKTANGIAPTLIAVPSWVGALTGGFLIFLVVESMSKSAMLTRKQSFGLLLQQISFGVIIALISGFSVATIANLADISLPSYSTVALFVSYTAFCFFLTISSITAWVGKPAITLFMVVMLVGMSVLMLPKEMLPDFFVNVIRPWIPLRFASEGLREIFYFGSGFYTGSSFLVISGIGLGGLIILLLSLFKKKK